MIKVDLHSAEIFTEIRSTSDNNFNKNFHWVQDGTGDIEMFIDRHIQLKTSDFHSLSKPSYGWLLESKTIIPEIYQWVEDYKSYLKLNFKGIFTHDAELSKKDPDFFLLTMCNAAPWVTDRNIHPKSKLISMISSDKSFAEGHRHRLSLVDKYRNGVDLYGRGIRTFSRKEEPLVDYMFSINIENAKYDNYFTEKLTDCFACGTVPIFYGSDAIVDEMFDSRGVIKLTHDFSIDQVSKDLYYDMMPYIKNNFEIACQIKTAEDYIEEKYFA